MSENKEFIANAYGLPYLQESDQITLEDPDSTIKRIVVMNQRVTIWILQNRRIPSSNPNAGEEEKLVAHWLKALQFYADVAIDPQFNNEQSVNDESSYHDLCQFILRHGYTPTTES